MQQIIETDSYADALREVLSIDESLYVVCSKRERERLLLDLKGYSITFFHGYSPNPKYEEIMEGVELFKQGEYETIVALGGGSALDVAKCIKLFQEASKEDFLNNKFVENRTRLIAIPTTAGTGSESTAIAVIYYEGEKYSVAHVSALPRIAILDGGLLQTLPEYHKKSAMADALCQAIESYWSKGATAESKHYAEESISLILEYGEKYLSGTKEGAVKILKAANYSGKAIHISRTTAAHAMSYKLTTRYGISHGHAVALCMQYCWKNLLQHATTQEGLSACLCELAKVMGCDSIESSVHLYEKLYASWNFPTIEIPMEDMKLLVSSVNVERLGNHPVALTEEDLSAIYTKIRLHQS